MVVVDDFFVGLEELGGLVQYTYVIHINNDINCHGSC